MSLQNNVFYIEDGKFYISRHVLIAIFRLLIGSQRPDKWSDELLLRRFERTLPLYPNKTAGIFHPVFERAAAVPFENWVMTNNPLPRFETLYPQINMAGGETSEDMIDDDNEATLETTTPDSLYESDQLSPCQHWKQRPKFRFDTFGIEVGAVLTFKRDSSITVTVMDGKTAVASDHYDIGTSWTNITRQLTGFAQVAPVDYWCYNGVLLRKIYDGKSGASRKKAISLEEKSAISLEEKSNTTSLSEPQPEPVPEQAMEMAHETLAQESDISVPVLFGHDKCAGESKTVEAVVDTETGKVISTTAVELKQATPKLMIPIMPVINATIAESIMFKPAAIAAVPFQTNLTTPKE